MQLYGLKKDVMATILVSLEKLVINNNNLSSIDANTFNDLSNLSILHMSDNKLTSIDPNAFNGLTSLQK